MEDVQKQILYILSYKIKISYDTDYRTDTREEQHTEIMLILLEFAFILATNKTRV
jgi:hypothetical protein